MKRMFYAAHTPSSLSRLVRSSVLFSSPRSLFRAPRLNHPSFHRPPRFPAKPYRQYTPYAPLSLCLSLCPASLLHYRLPTTTYHQQPFLLSYPNTGGPGRELLLTRDRVTRPVSVARLVDAFLLVYLPIPRPCSNSRLQTPSAIQGEPLSREPTSIYPDDQRSPDFG